MTITALKKKGSDVLIFLDDGTFLNLDYRIVLDYGLRKADHLDEKKIDLLKEKNSFLKARDSALRILARRRHSSYELKTKLFKKNYSKEVIGSVIQNLNEFSYLNDEEFASAYISERIKQRKIGTNRLKAELFKKGIDSKIAVKVLNETDKTELNENAYEIAKKKLKILKNKESDARKISSKLFAFLLSKGYEADLIKTILNNLKIEFEE